MNKHRPHRLNTDTHQSQTRQEMTSHQRRSTVFYCPLWPEQLDITCYILLFTTICMHSQLERLNLFGLRVMLCRHKSLSPTARLWFGYFHWVLHLIYCSGALNIIVHSVLVTPYPLWEKTFFWWLYGPVVHYINRSVMQSFPRVLQKNSFYNGSLKRCLCTFPPFCAPL